MFRRRGRAQDEARVQNDSPAAEPAEPDPGDDTGKPPRPSGPFDESEIDLERARADRVDLGGLLVPTGTDLKLQLQVDEKSGRATSAMVVLGDAAVQLIPVAAPRSSGLWEQTKLQILADAGRRGGTVEEAAGPFGTEVRIVLPVTTADGKKAVQPSRITGIDGPRWMLRVTFLGSATTKPDVFSRLVQVVRDTVVIRGQAPMPPGDLIPLRPPEQPEQA
jgi:hypothetical protein